MTDPAKPKRRRKVDDDAKLATAISAIAEEIKTLATASYGYGTMHDRLVERMDDVIRSMHSVNSGRAIKEGD